MRALTVRPASAFDRRTRIPIAPGGKMDLMDAKELAQKARVVAVVGASPDPSRPSYEVLQYLIEQGFEAVPVRPGGEVILGLRSVESLADVDKPIDIVDVFRRSEAAADVTRDAVAAGARGVWLQEGVRSDEAAGLAREAGIAFVQDLCLKKVLKDLAKERKLREELDETDEPGKRGEAEERSEAGSPGVG